uniref:Sulfate_transp domain-containing protein n=1 Tax=Macrostomum lignano TaxID=282301 RepID=A0A1I8F770_9PLAT
AFIVGAALSRPGFRIFPAWRGQTLCWYSLAHCLVGRAPSGTGSDLETQNERRIPGAVNREHMCCCLSWLFLPVRGLFQEPAMLALYSFKPPSALGQCRSLCALPIGPIEPCLPWTPSWAMNSACPGVLAVDLSRAVACGLEILLLAVSAVRKLAGSPAAVFIGNESAQRQMAGGRRLLGRSGVGVGWPLARCHRSHPPAPWGAELVSTSRLRNRESLRRLGRLLRSIGSRLNKSALAAAALTGEPFWSAAGAALGSALATPASTPRCALAALNSGPAILYLLTAKLAVSAACTMSALCAADVEMVGQKHQIFSITNCIGGHFCIPGGSLLSVRVRVRYRRHFHLLFLRFGHQRWLARQAGSKFMTDDLKNLVFDTCDAMTSNLPPGSIGNSSSRRQAAARHHAADILRLSELEDPRPDGGRGRTLLCSRRAGPTRLCRCAGCRRRRPVKEADDDLAQSENSCQHPDTLHWRPPADQGSGDNAQPRLFDLLA